MGHLTVDEIIDFVSLTKLTKEAVELSAIVNGHIRRCDKCLNLVRSFRAIHDEFVRMNISGDFQKYLYNAEMNAKEKNELTQAYQELLEDYDKYK